MANAPRGINLGFSYREEGSSFPLPRKKPHPAYSESIDFAGADSTDSYCHNIKLILDPRIAKRFTVVTTDDNNKLLQKVTGIWGHICYFFTQYRHKKEAKEVIGQTLADLNIFLAAELANADEEKVRTYRFVLSELFGRGTFLEPYRSGFTKTDALSLLRLKEGMVRVGYTFKDKKLYFDLPSRELDNLSYAKNASHLPLFEESFTEESEDRDLDLYNLSILIFSRPHQKFRVVALPKANEDDEEEEIRYKLEKVSTLYGKVGLGFRSIFCEEDKKVKNCVAGALDALNGHLDDINEFAEDGKIALKAHSYLLRFLFSKKQGVLGNLPKAHFDPEKGPLSKGSRVSVLALPKNTVRLKFAGLNKEGKATDKFFDVKSSLFANHFSEEEEVLRLYDMRLDNDDPALSHAFYKLLKRKKGQVYTYDTQSKRLVTVKGAWRTLKYYYSFRNKRDNVRKVVRNVLRSLNREFDKKTEAGESASRYLGNIPENELDKIPENELDKISEKRREVYRTILRHFFFDKGSMCRMSKEIFQRSYVKETHLERSLQSFLHEEVWKSKEKLAEELIEHWKVLKKESSSDLRTLSKKIIVEGNKTELSSIFEAITDEEGKEQYKGLKALAGMKVDEVNEEGQPRQPQLLELKNLAAQILQHGVGDRAPRLKELLEENHYKDYCRRKQQDPFSFDEEAYAKFYSALEGLEGDADFGADALLILTNNKNANLRNLTDQIAEAIQDEQKENLKQFYELLHRGEYQKTHENGKKAFFDSTYAEFELAGMLGVRLKGISEGGSGGACYAFDRYGEKNSVIKRFGTGPYGSENRRWDAYVKQAFNSGGPSSIRGNNETSSEWLSYLFQGQSNIVPPTERKSISCEDFAGVACNLSSFQVFVKGAKPLGDYLGLSPKMNYLPRSVIRWLYKSPRLLSWLNPKSPDIDTDLLIRIALHNFLIGDIDCHFDNILVKKVKTENISPVARLFTPIELQDENFKADVLDKITEEDIRKFAHKLFHPGKEKGSLSNHQQLLQAFFAAGHSKEWVKNKQTGKREQQDVLVSLIKHDGGGSFTRHHPRTYLEHRFRFLFEVLPQFGSKAKFFPSFPTEGHSHIAYLMKDDTYFNRLLLELIERQFQDFIESNDVYNALVREKKDLLLEWVKALAASVTQTDLQVIRDAKTRAEKIREELTKFITEKKYGWVAGDGEEIPHVEDLGFFNRHMLDFQKRNIMHQTARHFARTEGVIATTFERWVLLRHALDANRPMRELFRVRREKDFKAAFEKLRGQSAPFLDGMRAFFENSFTSENDTFKCI